MAGQAAYRPLQEKQLSDLSPLYFEVSRFADGSKLIALLDVRRPNKSGDGAKIRNYFENCSL